VELLRRNKVGGLGQCSHHGRTLFGGALHPTSLVVVFRTFDVDVVVVVLDAVLGINFFVQLVSQLRKNPPLENNSIDKCDEDNVKNDLPKDFADDVGGIKGDRDDFVPEGNGFISVVMAGFGEFSYVHSLSITLLRTIVNN
jgi:hypothetical protein